MDLDLYAGSLFLSAGWQVIWRADLNLLVSSGLPMYRVA